MRGNIIIFIVIGLILMVGESFLYHQSGDTVTITVTGKERIIERSGDGVTSKYLIFTETETFENSDVMTFGKYNSSDIQGRLREDSTYTVKVYGWRIPWMSSYRNIVQIKK